MVLGRMLLRTTACAGERRLGARSVLLGLQKSTPSSTVGVRVAFFMPSLLSPPRSNIILRQGSAASPRVRAENDIVRAPSFVRKQADLSVAPVILLNVTKQTSGGLGNY